ncbi:MAG: hypothetical protein Greene041679_688 [Parcubacteria group bacterium Greene0416_79]|nr:MAG: hypothetical protein Greene041679_688 [Parcubacteria group bacterium Greene0416_79]
MTKEKFLGFTSTAALTSLFCGRGRRKRVKTPSPPRDATLYIQNSTWLLELCILAAPYLVSVYGKPTAGKEGESIILFTFLGFGMITLSWCWSI